MKIINVVLGLGTAIILASLIHLGIRAFYPEPVSPYEAQPRLYEPKPYREFNCEKGDVKCAGERDAYFAQQDARNREMAEKDRAYQAQLKEYNRDVFVIANVVGVLVFVGGFLVLFKSAIASRSVPVGIMISGLWGIIYGYTRGWNSTDDQLKFAVGLAIAALVIGGSIWLVERYYNRMKQAHL